MNILSTVAHVEYLRFIAGPFALFADEFHVGEKLHFHCNRAIALAGLAPSARNVEGKVPRGKSALLGLRQRGKEFADGVKRLNVSHRIRPRRSSNGRLIDQYHFINKLIALQTFPRSRGPRRSCALLLLGLSQG